MVHLCIIEYCSKMKISGSVCFILCSRNHIKIAGSKTLKSKISKMNIYIRKYAEKSSQYKLA